ncbi:hypothetical protein [Streptomyces sp. NPDC002573]|uniref:hypothetical protein n=1 Tax=Streptomyces sp. NPDC002573 TaxID=3364651 RepID=UPI0036BA386F
MAKGEEKEVPGPGCGGLVVSTGEGPGSAPQACNDPEQGEGKGDIGHPGGTGAVRLARESQSDDSNPDEQNKQRDGLDDQGRALSVRRLLMGA